MKKLFLIVFLAGPVALNAQSLNIDFGSTFNEFDPLYPALWFCNADGIRYDTDLLGGQTGIIAVGYFDAIGSQGTFADYLDDFTQVGFASAFVAGEDGYLQASTNTTISITADVNPYVFVLGGVSDFANADAATSFSIFSDSSWGNFPSFEVIAPTLNLLTLQPDDIVVGNLISGKDGVDLIASKVDSVTGSNPVPEPSTHMLLLSGLLILNCYIHHSRSSLCKSCDQINS